METLILDWKDLLKLGLREDVSGLDWTARGVKNNTIRHWVIVAKETGVVSIELGVIALQHLGHELSLGHGFNVSMQKKDGEVVEKGEVLLRIEGTSQVVLGLERTFLNIAGYVCGIATQTKLLVDEAKKHSNKPPRITHTRKILPGYRNLAIHAVVCGGGAPHRPNLSAGILLKENHIAAAGGITTAIKQVRAVAPHGIKVEIEVRNEDELSQAIKANAEIVMLDNFSPDQIRQAIKNKPAGMLFEVSGGINQHNLKDYVIDGVDIISMGSMTHTVKCLDLSLLDRSLLN